MNMAAPGDKLYVVAHAYHHYLIEVVEVLGPRRVRAKNVVKIHSCRRGWTDFFKDGCGSDTEMMFFPDSNNFEYLFEFNWNHAIPKHPKGFPQ
jgi:hypothetical protein